METQVSLTVAFSTSAFFGLLFLIFLLIIPHRFSMGFWSGEFAGQSSTPIPWSFNQLLVLLAVWAGAKSIWSTLQSFEHQTDQTQEQFLPSGNPSHEHLTLNVEHTTLLYNYLFTTHTYFSFQICTCQTSYIIVCIVYCVSAILYIAY